MRFHEFFQATLVLTAVFVAASPSAVASPRLPTTLSDKGKAAYQVLLAAERFEPMGVGYDAHDSEHQEPFCTLLAESDADAAFKGLVADASLVGQIYGLCGLWFTDRLAFHREARRYGKYRGPLRCGMGCSEETWRLCDLIESHSPNAVRLDERNETIWAWRRVHPEGEMEVDFVGGGWPWLMARRCTTRAELSHAPEPAQRSSVDPDTAVAPAR